MKRLVAISVAVFFLSAGIAIAADAPKDAVVMKGTKQGDVTFKHETHKDKDCKTCHATAEGGKMQLDQKKGHETCQKCHMEMAKADPAKKALGLCTNCHAKKAS